MPQEEEHFEVWVMLERWNGDEKLEEVDTCKVGNVDDENGAKQLFDAAQSMSMAVVPHLDHIIKVYDD